MSTVEDAARAVLDAADALRDAINGQGHPGEEHNRDLWQPLPGDMQIYSPVGDCSACGGAEYQAEDALAVAYGDLRAALGRPRLPWEVR